jgi:long-chain-fatty-acyl-CoA reductase
MATLAGAEPRETVTRALPFVINGRRVESVAEGTVLVRAPSGEQVSFPAFAEDALRELGAGDRDLLIDVPLQEILSFLNRVGRQWRSEEYPRRRLYVRQLQELLGYSERAARAEADRIGVLLTSHARMHDVVAAELGSRFVLDGWVAREEAWVRAFPRGLSVHVLPGNVPASAAISIVRALITKNLCVTKAASGDPVTPGALALSFLDVDPQHPVSLATSAVYWRSSDVAAARLLARADAVCAWGGQDAIEWARRHTSAETPIACFGPKYSFALVGRDADVRATARGIAHDAVLYDQRACFSTQRVFVEGDPEPLLQALRQELDEHSRLLPPATPGEDELARVQLARLEDVFCGGRVESGEGWTIVLQAPPARGVEHPLGRVLYVHPVEALEQSYSFAGPEVQTVSAAPWSLLERHRDALARRGVSRFVEPGLSNLFRIGGTHDALNPLQTLVRMVSVEAPADVYGKGMIVAVNQTELLRAGKMKELVL